MSDDIKPLSELVMQGWEVLNYSVSDYGGVRTDNFLLRKQKMHPVLSVRSKMIGKGYTTKELDV
ncbi:MAG: hypothetical protein WBQ60_10000 [Asticcacaulis sp.]